MQPRIKRQNLPCPACSNHIARDIPALIGHLSAHHRGTPGAKYHLKGTLGRPICGVTSTLIHTLALDDFLEQRKLGLPVCKRCERSASLMKSSIDRIDKVLAERKLPDEATQSRMRL